MSYPDMKKPGAFVQELLCEFSSVEPDPRITDKYMRELAEFRRNSSGLPDAVIFGWVSFKQFEMQHRDSIGLHGDNCVITNEAGGGPNLPIFIDPTVEKRISFIEKSPGKHSSTFSDEAAIKGVKNLIKEAVSYAVKRGIGKKEIRKIIDEVFVAELLGE